MLGRGRDSKGGEGTRRGGRDRRRRGCSARRCTRVHRASRVRMRSYGALRRMGTGTVSPGVDISTTCSFAMHILLRLVSRVSAPESGPNASRTVLKPSLRMYCMRCTTSPGCRDYMAPASELETLNPLFIILYTRTWLTLLSERNATLH
jgi:hypothetical protein